MTRLAARFGIPLAVLALALSLAVACGGGSSGSGGNGNGATGSASEALEASNSSGGVEIQLTRVTAADEVPDGVGAIDLSGSVAFTVALTTHSGDLSKYDLKQHALLRVNGQDYPAAEGLFTRSDAHHPRGFLLFTVRPNEIGSAYQVVIQDLGGAPERVLKFGS